MLYPPARALQQGVEGIADFHIFQPQVRGIFHKYARSTVVIIAGKADTWCGVGTSFSIPAVEYRGGVVKWPCIKIQNLFSVVIPVNALDTLEKRGEIEPFIGGREVQPVTEFGNRISHKGPVQIIDHPVAVLILVP